jgi:hypothetical protein
LWVEFVILALLREVMVKKQLTALAQMVAKSLILRKARPITPRFPLSRILDLPSERN